MDITIRKALPGEEKDIARVNVDTWKSAYRGIVDDAFLGSLDAEQPKRLEKLRNGIDTGCVFVAADDGKTVGFATFGKASGDGFENLGELYALYVLDSYQRCGIGKRLVGAVSRALAYDGFDKFTIACFADNPSCRFYEKLGSKLAKRVECEIGGAEYGVNIYIFGTDEAAQD